VHKNILTPALLKIIRYGLVILTSVVSTLLAQETPDILNRHVPNEFARKKLELVQGETSLVVLEGSRPVPMKELLQRMHKTEIYDQYLELQQTSEKIHRRTRWLTPLARLGGFLTIFLGARQLSGNSQLNDWFPTLESGVVSIYVWIVAKRYNYRAAVMEKQAAGLLKDLDVGDWIADYNLKLYQQLVESGLTFSE